MLLVDYRLREFIEKFNDMVRFEEEDSKVKFKTVKKELLSHLENYNQTLRVLPELRISTILDKNILVEYRETTGSMMKLHLIWKVNSFNLEKIKTIISDLAKELNCTEPDEIIISDTHMSNVLAVYYQKSKKIIINNFMLLSHNDDEIKDILKHEMIHHKLSEKGLDASDTSEDFINEIIKHDAFVSGEPEAKKAYDKVKKKKSRK